MFIFFLNYSTDVYSYFFDFIIYYLYLNFFL